MLWTTLEALVDQALGDKMLAQMPICWGDWQSTFTSFGISKEGWQLIKYLEQPEFDEFNQKQFHSGFTSQMVYPGLLATWLVKTAKDYGAKYAVDGLKSYLEQEEVTVLAVAVLQGMDFDKVVEFENGITLGSIESLPQPFVTALVSQVYKTKLDINPPITCLFKKVKVHKGTSRNPELFHSIFNQTFTCASILTLFATSNAPTIAFSKVLLSTDTPFSGIVDTSYNYQLETKHPETVDSWAHIDAQTLKDCFKMFINIKEQYREPLSIALHRLSQSMNSWDNANKSIDLGIALEAALLSYSGSKDQLAFQLRLTGALLSSDDTNERMKNFELLNKIYANRSSAAHTGKVASKPTVSVKGFQQKMSLTELTQHGTQLTQIIIRKIIELGGLDKEKYMRLILSGGIESK